MAEIKEFSFIMTIEDDKDEATIAAAKRRLVYELGDCIANVITGPGEYRITFDWHQIKREPLNDKRSIEHEMVLRGLIYKVDKEPPLPPRWL